MHSNNPQGTPSSDVSQKGFHIGVGLTDQQANGSLNGNRNYRGRFNIELSALASNLKEQGIADKNLLAR